jgi:hypothetical protein
VARRSLKPQLNQIRTWVGQGRTDAWIAHQLEVSVGDLVAFKREHDLAPPESGDGDQEHPFGGAEEDLRAQDDALVAAALDAEPDEDEEEVEDETGAGDEDGEEDGDGEAQAKPRRRGRRGGRGRRTPTRSSRALEGTFDHGEEGYGLWLDPEIQDDPTYAEHWAGHRPVTVTVERDRIVIRRAGEEDGAGPADDDGES